MGAALSLGAGASARAQTSAGSSAPSASAARGSVVLLDTPMRSVLDGRIAAELEALGFAVQRRPRPPGALDRAGLERVAREAGAFASLAVEPLAGGAEVWLADRATGKTALREVVLATDGDLAVRVVELLRASLLELGSALPPRGEVPPPPAAVDMAARDRAMAPAPAAPPEPGPLSSPPLRSSGSLDKGTLFVGGALSLSPGGLSPLPHVRVGGGLRLAERLGFELDLVIPTLPAEVSRPEGGASVLPTWCTAGLTVSLTGEQSPFRVRAGLGAGLEWVHVSARPLPPFVGSDADFFAGVLQARLGFAYAFTSLLRARLDLDLGFATPELGVRFAGERVASFGLPLFAPALGLEVGLPSGGGRP